MTELNYADVDISSVAPDLAVPPMVSGLPDAGVRVRQTHPDFLATDVYHALYLPTDWKPGGSYPVIIEFAGNGPYNNEFDDLSTGLVEGSRLGMGISMGKKYIWVCMPFLNNTGQQNVTRWWGNPSSFDARPTVEYCRKTVRWICEQYGGDPDRVLLTGFSRGAIACNYIGLYDDDIASLWRAMVVCSHYDGVVQWEYPGSDQASAIARLKRLGKCPQFICHETVSDDRHGLKQTRTFLSRSGVVGNFTFHSTQFRNHTDAWILRPSEPRRALHSWVQRQLSDR